MKVLVVDDELPIRRWITAALEKITELPVEVVGTAANGVEALAIIQKDKPQVVLADIKMPVMDGLTLLRRIKETDEHIEVVILTCHEDFSYAREAVSQKAYDYILKTEITPRKLGSLLLKIQKEIQSRSYSDKWMTIYAQREYCLTQLINNSGHMENREIKEMLLDNHINLKEDALFAIAFYKDAFLNERVRSDAESIQDEKVENLIFYSYNNKINIAIGNICNVSSLLYQKNVQYEFAKKLSRRFQSKVGVSDLYYSYKKIPDMMRQSTYALELGFYDDLNLYQYQSGCSYQEAEKDLERIKTEILKAVNNEQSTLAQQQIQWIYEKLKKSPIYEIYLLKSYFVTIITGFLLKIYAEKSECFIKKMNYYQSMVEMATNLSQVKNIMDEICDELKTAIHYDKPFYTQHIAKAIEYLDANYRGACNVSEIADYIGLNSDYLCRLFK